MAWSLLVSTAGTQTTSAIDTTGATLITIVGVNNVDGQGISDSKSNTWTKLTVKDGSSNTSTAIYYCVNPTVGSGHTFSGAVSTSALAVAAWSGNAASPFDVQNGTANAGEPAQAGSITPSQDSELIVFGIGSGGSSTSYSVDSGFTIWGHVDESISSYGIAASYLLQGSAAAVNPSMSFTGSLPNTAAVIASFKIGATTTTFNVSSGSFTLTGDTAVATSTMPGTAASFTLTGASAQLIPTTILNATAGSFTLTGSPETGPWTFSVSSVSFALSGVSAQLLPVVEFNALPGSFTLTGDGASFSIMAAIAGREIGGSLQQTAVLGTLSSSLRNVRADLDAIPYTGTLSG